MIRPILAAVALAGLVASAVIPGGRPAFAETSVPKGPTTPTPNDPTVGTPTVPGSESGPGGLAPGAPTVRDGTTSRSAPPPQGRIGSPGSGNSH